MKLQIGDRVICNGHEGTVRKVHVGQLKGMADVRLERGTVCTDISELGLRCTACGEYHRDHSAVHFQWIDGDVAGVCWSADYDHQPMEGDFLVTNNIRKVTCEKCKKDYRMLNDLCKVMSGKKGKKGGAPVAVDARKDGSLNKPVASANPQGSGASIHESGYDPDLAMAFDTVEPPALKTAHGDSKR